MFQSSHVYMNPFIYCNTLFEQAGDSIAFKSFAKVPMAASLRGSHAESIPWDCDTVTDVGVPAVQLEPATLATAPGELLSDTKWTSSSRFKGRCTTSSLGFHFSHKNAQGTETK